MPETAPSPASVDRAPPTALCSYCHQPILPTYYYCPNCGSKLNEAPLSTSPTAQALLYGAAIVLPMICYLLISKWPAWKYFKSQDRKTHEIGLTALTLLVLSSIVTIWFAYVQVTDAIQQYTTQLNQQLSGY